MTSEALYKTIFKDLQAQIENGIYEKSDLLPTEANLCKQYNVSRVTIRQAIQLLVDHHYVQKIQGSGSHVIYSPQKKILDRSPKIKSFSQEIHGMNKTPSAKVIKFELTFATKKLSQDLSLEMQSPVFYYERLLYADEIPFCFEYGYMPVKYFPDFSILNLTTSKMNYIENEKNLLISYTTQVVNAISANKKLHLFLNVPVDSPLLEVTHLSYTKEDTPLFKTCIIFDSKKYTAHFIKTK